MRSHIASIEIAADPADAFASVADLAQLPRWAIGYAKAIDRDDVGWIVTTAGGDRVRISVDTDRRHGVVDYVMSPAPGVELPANTRVVPLNGGSLYTFVMQQAPGMSDEVFDRQVGELERELMVLKAHLETSCPL
jgi:hypothetical protein